MRTVHPCRAWACFHVLGAKTRRRRQNLSPLPTGPRKWWGSRSHGPSVRPDLTLCLSTQAVVSRDPAILRFPMGFFQQFLELRSRWGRSWVK